MCKVGKLACDGDLGCYVGKVAGELAGNSWIRLAGSYMYMPKVIVREASTGAQLP